MNNKLEKVVKCFATKTKSTIFASQTRWTGIFP